MSGASGPVLALDASTSQGSLALLDGARVLGEAVVAMRGADEERLLPAVADVLQRAGVAPGALGAVACGAGPGSFTGLRIAAATAKGLAQALGVPLHAVPSLELAAAGAEPHLPPGRYLVVADALRAERFVLPVTVRDDGTPEPDGATALVSEPVAAALAEGEGRTRIGPAERVAVWPHARGVGRLWARVLAAPIPLAAWQPEYGRLAEAQARWEAAHGRRLEVG